MRKNWTKIEMRAAEKASSLPELAEVAIEILKKMPQPIATVCGPMTTGGFGSFEANMRFFAFAIEKVESHGFSVFNQMVFQMAMEKILKDWPEEKVYCKPILTDFYGKIFKSGYIKMGLFLPNRKTSYGAKWEWKQFRRLGLLRAEIPKEWLEGYETWKPS